MATKTRDERPMAWPKSKAGQWDDVPPLPPGCKVSLSTAQVRLSLGGISERLFREMVVTGEFPGPDWKCGALLRWDSETVNEWLRKREEAHRGERPQA